MKRTHLALTALLLISMIGSAARAQPASSNYQGKIEQALKLQIGDLLFNNTLLSVQNRQLNEDIATLRAKIEEMQKAQGQN